MTIDLVLLGADRPVAWPHGRVHPVAAPTPAAVSRLLQAELHASNAGAWLFWDVALGAPDAARVRALLDGVGDVWHAGLRLGTRGMPRLIDCVSPTWPLNRDPDADIEATSWRISLRACLVRADVLRQLGGPHPAFRSLDAAALELGHRFISRGAFVRHVPSLVPPGDRAVIELNMEDELRFVAMRFGPRWTAWAAMRRLLGTPSVAHTVAATAWRVHRSVPSPTRAVYASRPLDVGLPAAAQVTVLVPTVHRYPYLRVLLAQLREQTVRPHEIIVVDQSPPEARDDGLRHEFADLPLTVLVQDSPGQCTSRNAGLDIATGDFVLFLDDDDEVEPTLIERHLRTIAGFGADSCSGIADEVGAGEVPESYRFLRVSNVFPTNNTLVRRDALAASGLFDLAFNRAQKADGDLGMRFYLSGALMVLDPSIRVLHHHAPSGGLRTHKARVVTYASSRQSVTQRHLPSVSEIYLAMRYFTPRQVTEMLWHRTAGTFSVRGGMARRAAKLVLSGLRLPQTVREIRRRRAAASAMLLSYPRIPALERDLQEV